MSRTESPTFLTREVQRYMTYEYQSEAKYSLAMRPHHLVTDRVDRTSIQSGSLIIAAIDHIVHHSIVIDCQGESFRKQHALKKRVEK